MYPTFKSDGQERGPAVDLAFLRARREIDEFLSYFGFRESPFGVTPDPGFLFFSKRHREVLDAMIQAIESNLGFTVLLGEPGLGKTTLLFQLLAQYRDSARTAFIFLTRCKPSDLLRYLASELELPGLNRDEVAFHQRLNDLLVREARAGRKVLIILDEAQNLNHASLETIRLLSGFESPSSKLLHVILAGSARLGETLKAAKQSPLAQRISTLCRLEPLKPDEVAEYVKFRLGVAGAKDIRGLFPADALDEVASQSGGVPRLVNSISYHALWLACSRGEHHLSAELVREAARDLDLSASTGMNFSGTQPVFVSQEVKVAEPLIEPNEREPLDMEPADKPDLLSLLAESICDKEQPIEADEAVRQSPVHPFVPSAEEDPQSLHPADDFAESVKHRLYSPDPSEVSTPALKSRPWTRAGWLGDGVPAYVRVTRLLRSRTAGVNTERALVSLAVLLLLGLGFWTGWHQLIAKTRPAAQYSTRVQPEATAPHAKDAEVRGGEVQPQADGAERTVAAGYSQPAVDPIPMVGAKPHPPTQAVSTLPSGQPTRISRRPALPSEAPTPNNLASFSRNFESVKVALNAVPTAVPHLDIPTARGPSPTPVNGDASVLPAPSLRPTRVVQPEYPEKARLWHVEGEVLLELRVDQQGNVEKVKPLSGNPLLIQAAANAAQQWRYAPSETNESSVTHVKFNFKLGSDSRR